MIYYKGYNVEKGNKLHILYWCILLNTLHLMCFNDIVALNED